MTDDSSVPVQRHEDIRQLLASAPAIRSACELDLLLFLYRHPRTLLTNEQLAAFVGYDMKLVANAIDQFVDAGLLERTLNPTHAARMYLLVLEDPENEGISTLLEMASTRQGRAGILRLLRSERNPAVDIIRSKRRFHATV